jgi:CAAX protease family protein
MNRVQAALRRYAAVLICIWLVLGAGGIIYSRFLSIPVGIAIPLLVALLVEISLYFAPAFREFRETLAARYSAPRIAAGLVVGAVVPYLIYSLPTGQFRVSAITGIVLLATVAAGWYLAMPHKPASDFAFLAFLAGIVLWKVFPDLYPSPAPRIRIDILGQLMWIRTGVGAMLILRRIEGTGFGFVPLRGDWGIGLRHYVYFLPVGIPLALGTGLVRFRPVPLEWWKVTPLAAATFFGMLWVVALSEEFFFRGVLQHQLSRLLANETAAVLIASVLFGLAHLPFRQFPNWRFALVATIAGCFYGRAFSRAGSIRAAMVTHALVNTTTRMLFV